MFIVVVVRLMRRRVFFGTIAALSLQFSGSTTKVLVAEVAPAGQAAGFSNSASTQQIGDKLDGFFSCEVR